MKPAIYQSRAEEFARAMQENPYHASGQNPIEYGTMNWRGVGALVKGEDDRYYEQARGQYLFPLDLTALDGHDIFNKFCSVARGGSTTGWGPVHTCPLAQDRDLRVLDLGCGSGVWVLDMADLYPRAWVQGYDLELTQARDIPSNVKYYRTDVEGPWPDVALGSLDMVHARDLKGSIQGWPALYQQIFRHLKPQVGYVERIELDWTPHCDDDSFHPYNCSMRDWLEEMLSAMDQFGRSMKVDPDATRAMLYEAGFVDIEQRRIRVPFNGWPVDAQAKEVGRWFNLHCTTSLLGISLAPLARVKHRSISEIKELVQRVREEMCLRDTHGYVFLYIWTARRP